ncbi:MAG: ATP-binding protein [Prevotellaceae bacterium]|jgi:hypothetical protein|nr:ATP-binding protein [Prevotellaceae bacterium]
MARALSNNNVLDAKFNVADFGGEWLASFGRPELRGSWIVFGGSGSGKTTFMLMLGKYLTKFTNVAYNSLEQGLSLSLKKAWERVGMENAGNKIILLEKESLKDLRTRLRKKRSPDVILIDSLHYWLGFKMSDYMSLVGDFRNKLFVFCAHEQNKEPKGGVAQYIRYNSDVKIHVEGYKAYITTRYEDRENNEGGEDFVIWKQGANEFDADNL